VSLDHYVPLINGSDTNFSHPYVLHYPGNSYPTDSPRPQLNTYTLQQYSNGGSDDHGGLTGNRIGCETAADGVCAALISMTNGAAVMRAG
jgi:hypothetical protein